MNRATSALRALFVPVIVLWVAAAHAESLPRDGRFNLRCLVAIRTVSGPNVSKTSTVNYAIDLQSQHWCLPQEGCKARYILRRQNASLIELVAKDAFADHESALVNLETGKLAGHSDDAPNGLGAGFRTYLAEGQCRPLPYSEASVP